MVSDITGQNRPKVKNDTDTLLLSNEMSNYGNSAMESTLGDSDNAMRWSVM